MFAYQEFCFDDLATLPLPTLEFLKGPKYLSGAGFFCAAEEGANKWEGGEGKEVKEDLLECVGVEERREGGEVEEEEEGRGGS